MKEYIERDAALEIAFERIPMSLCVSVSEYDAMNRAIGMIYKLLRDIPAADVVEVRHAYWRDIQPPDQDNNVQCWCSACGAGELHAKGMIVPHCWKCGAKMDGGAE